MSQDSAYRDYQFAFAILRRGIVAELEELAAIEPSFPAGEDGFIGRRWIINAIDSESIDSVRWMISKDVALRFRDDEGYTPLHAALECGLPVRYEFMRLLLLAGADVNLKGINDYTPAHCAAARDDVEALKVLIEFGADLTIRTDIDEYATPMEEAEMLGSMKAVEFLATLA